MKVTQITVSAGRTLQHPCESYANIRPAVTLTATLAEDDDPNEAVRELQRTAEQLVEHHATVLRASLLERDVAERENEELARLTQSISDNQSRLNELQDRVIAREQVPANRLF